VTLYDFKGIKNSLFASLEAIPGAQPTSSE